MPPESERGASAGAPTAAAASAADNPLGPTLGPAALRAGAAFRLALPTGRLRGAAGERLGGGTGSSLELTDLRDYALGDDPRHLDWRAFARSDRLQVRLYRDEVSPFVDLVLDLSASMAISEAKARAFVELATAFIGWVERAGGRPRLLQAGGGALSVDLRAASAGAYAQALVPNGDDAASLVPRVPLATQGVRVLLTDLLRRQDPVPDLARLAQGGACLYVVQLLDPWEANPEVLGPVELCDHETGERLEVDLDERAVAVYRQRLARLVSGCERAVRGAGGRFVQVLADDLAVMARTSLLPAGIIDVA